MSVNMPKDGKRSLKTQRALENAMSSLLTRQKFSRITVSDICDEALISRATFYSRFIDKYDLLKCWLEHLLPLKISCANSYERIEPAINGFILENRGVIKNIICDANDETLDVLFEALICALGFDAAKCDNGETNIHYIVLSNIYAGGLLHYLVWLVKNNFPSNVSPMNIYLYDIANNAGKYASDKRVISNTGNERIFAQE